MRKMVWLVTPEMDPSHYIIIEIRESWSFLSCFLRPELPITLFAQFSQAWMNVSSLSLKKLWITSRKELLVNQKYRCYYCEGTQYNFHTSSSRETAAPQWFQLALSSCLAPPLSSASESVCSWDGWGSRNSYGLVRNLAWAWYIGLNQCF